MGTFDCHKQKSEELPVPTHAVWDGCEVCIFAGESELESFRWDELVGVFGFKQDCFAVDRIWIVFEICGRAEPVCVHEEIDGYASLIAEMERRCVGFRPDWWHAVAFPAFAENRTVIWRRDGGNTDA